MNDLSRYFPSVACLSRAAVVGLLLLLLSACGSLEGSTRTASGKQPPKALNEKERMEFTRAFIDANKMKILGDQAQAKKLFLQALKIDPDNGAVKHELAKLTADQGRFAEALQYSRAAFDSDPDNIWYAHFLAQLYAETGSLDKSIDIFKQIIKRQPDEFENYFNLAGLLSAQGRYNDALAIFDQLESRLGPLEEISVQRQLIYMEKGDFERALKEVTALIDTNPEEIRYYGMKAEILQHMNRQGEAKELYEIMLAENPENGLVLLALYEIAEKGGELEKAEDYMSRAFESRDLNVDVKVNIMLNYLSSRSLKHKPDFIIGLGHRLETAHPDEAKAYAIQGDVYYNLNQLENARSKFRQAVALDANRPPIWQQILTINSQLGDFESMKRESDEAVELFPLQPLFYLFNGIAHLQDKDTDKAIEALESGLALVIDNEALQAQFYASLGDAYNQAGNNEKSDRAYQRSLDIDGSNSLVLNNFAYYLSLRGQQLEKAEAMAKKANNLSPDVASYQDTYGWVLYMRGNYRNALFWIEEALKNGAENDPVVLDHYGDVLMAVDRKADAVRAWQQAIDAGGNEDALRSKINGVEGGE